MNRLFVYGSLAPGRSHHYLLAGLPGYWQKARVSGYFFPNGTAGTRGWPALKPSSRGTAVAGYILTSKRLTEHWRDLDKFEGHFYRRVKARAALENGANISVFLYRQRWMIRTPV